MHFYQQKTTRKKLVKILLARIGLIFWVLSISVHSFSPLDNIQLPNFFSADKLAHVGMYFILVVLLNYAFMSKKSYHVGLFFAFIYSVLTEVIQHYYIVNRYGEFADFLANLIGLILAYLIFRNRIKT